MNDNNSSEYSYVEQTRIRAQEKAKEIQQLMHEKERIDVQIERSKKYFNQLNSFLEGEGQDPIVLKEPGPGKAVGKIGNRTKDFPVRKVEWVAMTIEQIVKAILDEAPNEVFHADKIANMIYEIQSEKDLHRVKVSLVSILRKSGKQKGLWKVLSRNYYQSNQGITPQSKLLKS